MEVGGFEYDDVGASDEFDGRDFDAVDAPFFGLDVQAAEVLGCARSDLKVELCADGFGSAVEDAEGLNVSAVSCDSVVDDFAVVAGA